MPRTSRRGLLSQQDEPDRVTRLRAAWASALRKTYSLRLGLSEMLWADRSCLTEVVVAVLEAAVPDERQRVTWGSFCRARPRFRRFTELLASERPAQQSDGAKKDLEPLESMYCAY
jgi:hypothetical protein